MIQDPNKLQNHTTNPYLPFQPHVPLLFQHLNHQGLILDQNLLSKEEHGNPLCFDIIKDLQSFMLQKTCPTCNCPKHV